MGYLRWLVLGVLVGLLAMAVVVLGQHGPAPEPSQRPQAGVALPPTPVRPDRPAGREEASAGSSGPPDRAAATTGETQVASGGGEDQPVLRQEGSAAYYADKYEGRTTASGAQFTQDDLTAASHTLPLGARATVIRRDTGQSVEVTVTDRGPQVEGRVVDLSKAAAQRLDMIKEGVAPVSVEARPSQQTTPELAEKVLQEAHAQTGKHR